ncbi:MAG TPA: flagellar hook capping FlgD N-terminal domain-containing protein [Verrucomicrobiae bacterium]|nr:flagellar hook capping FlgD N-terminal domain-containing protein [Verrucomicrobiae bacterium]
MSVSPVTNSTTTDSQNVADAVSSATSQTLSEQDFLNLLVTQMTQQDPLDPMTNEDMLGQMVQFSTLQSNTTMQSLLTGMQSGQSTSQADSLIGMQVNVQTDSNGDTTQGVVSGVDLSSGTPQIIVNGQEYGLDQVLSVSPPSSQTTN